MTGGGPTGAQAAIGSATANIASARNVLNMLNSKAESALECADDG
jgi:hypothetical protein